MAQPNVTGLPAASDSMTAGAATERWSRREVVALAGALILGIAIRVLLLPTSGLRGDLDQFVLWVHGIAVGGLPNAYDQDLSFPPVMAYVWGVLAAIEPAFRSLTNASDPAIRALMKLPASAADVGIALLVAYALRDRPRWAVLGAAAILFHPAVIDISAWWGQYESIYLLSALAATILAINGRNGWAAAAIALSLMTKPQALPFLVPFAAWFWATGGWRGLLRAAAIGLAVIVVLWLPFIPAAGPANYLRNLATYQGETFAILSLRAWNMWWLVEEAAGGFIADNVPFLGPLTLRDVGYGIAGLLEIVVAIAVVRNPRPRTLFLGLAAAVLVAFASLTTMHERYAYGALIFLTPLIPEPRLRWVWIAFGVVFALNLVAAVPPIPEIGALITTDGWMGVLGPIAMLAITAATVAFVTPFQGPARAT